MKRINFYDQSIDRMWEQVLLMGNKTDLLLEKAIKALLARSTDEIKDLMELEDWIDEMEETINLKSLELISLQQPSIDDLRKLSAFMRIVRELERVGDLGVNLGKAVEKLVHLGEYFKPLIDIPKMAGLSQEMIRKSLAAYKEQDVKLARLTCEMDDAIDKLYADLQIELVEYMKINSQHIEQACQFLLIARDLERIGDHAENIAEMVIFMVTGDKRFCE